MAGIQSSIVRNNAAATSLDSKVRGRQPMKSSGRAVKKDRPYARETAARESTGDSMSLSSSETIGPAILERHVPGHPASRANTFR